MSLSSPKPDAGISDAISALRSFGDQVGLAKIAFENFSGNIKLPELKKIIEDFKANLTDITLPETKSTKSALKDLLAVLSEISALISRITTVAGNSNKIVTLGEILKLLPRLFQHLAEVEVDDQPLFEYIQNNLPVDYPAFKEKILTYISEKTLGNLLRALPLPKPKAQPSAVPVPMGPAGKDEKKAVAPPHSPLVPPPLHIGNGSAASVATVATPKGAQLPPSIPPPLHVRNGSAAPASPGPTPKSAPLAGEVKAKPSVNEPKTAVPVPPPPAHRHEKKSEVIPPDQTLPALLDSLFLWLDEQLPGFKDLPAAAQDEALDKIIIKVNKALRALVIKLDEFELYRGWKEGTLASIPIFGGKTLVEIGNKFKSYHEQCFRAAGYPVENQDFFPYRQTILKHRIKLIAELVAKEQSKKTPESKTTADYYLARGLTTYQAHDPAAKDFIAIEAEDEKVRERMSFLQTLKNGLAVKNSVLALMKSEEYELCLMPEDDTREPKKLYISADEAGLHYEVLEEKDDEFEVNSAVIPWVKLPEVPHDAKQLVNEKNEKHLQKILAVTGEAGHTPTLASTLEEYIRLFETKLSEMLDEKILGEFFPELKKKVVDAKASAAPPANEAASDVKDAKADAPAASLAKGTADAKAPTAPPANGTVSVAVDAKGKADAKTGAAAASVSVAKAPAAAAAAAIELVPLTAPQADAAAAAASAASATADEKKDPAPAAIPAPIASDWIPKLVKSLKLARELLAKYKSYQHLQMQIIAKKKAKVSPIVSMSEDADRLNAALQLGKEFIDCSNDIKRDAFVQSLLKNGKKKSQEVPTESKGIIAEVKGTPYYSTRRNNAAEKLGERVKKENKATGEAVQAAIEAADRLAQAFSAWSSDKLQPAKGSSDYIKFAFNNRAIISQLQAHVGQALSSLGQTITADLLPIIRRINLLLREIFLFADEIEISLYLKEGYVTKLGGETLYTLVKTFHETLRDQKYEFVAEEQFPYQNAIRKQREKMKATDPRNLYKIAFIEARIKSLKEDAKDILVSDRRIQLRDQLQIRIEFLKQQRHKSYFFASGRRILEDRIAGLTQMQKYLSKPGYSIEDALSAVGSEFPMLTLQDSLRNNDLEFLQQLRDSFRDLDQVKVIDCPVQKSVVMDAKKKVVFKAKPVSETKAVAPGEEKNAVKAASADEKKAGAPDEKKDAGKAALTDEKKVGASDKKEALPIPAPVAKPLTETDYVLKKLRDRIQQLESEQDKAFIKSATKMQKILLLREVESAFTDASANRSFTDAIEYVRKNSVHRNNFYLLHEGRTGRMLNEAQSSLLTKADIMKRIDLEIERLRPKENRKLWVRQAARNQVITERIRALEQLREAISKIGDDKLQESGESLETFHNKLQVNSLSTIKSASSPQKIFTFWDWFHDDANIIAATRALLKSYEESLLLDICTWDKARRDKNSYLRKNSDLGSPKAVGAAAAGSPVPVAGVAVAPAGSSAPAAGAAAPHAIDAKYGIGNGTAIELAALRAANAAGGSPAAVPVGVGVGVGAAAAAAGSPAATPAGGAAAGPAIKPPPRHRAETKSASPAAPPTGSAAVRAAAAAGSARPAAPPPPPPRPALPPASARVRASIVATAANPAPAPVAVAASAPAVAAAVAAPAPTRAPAPSPTSAAPAAAAPASAPATAPAPAAAPTPPPAATAPAPTPAPATPASAASSAAPRAPAAAANGKDSDLYTMFKKQDKPETPAASPPADNKAASASPAAPAAAAKSPAKPVTTTAPGPSPAKTRPPLRRAPSLL